MCVYSRGIECLAHNQARLKDLNKTIAATVFESVEMRDQDPALKPTVQGQN